MIADWLVIEPNALPPASFLEKELREMAGSAGHYHINYMEEYVPKGRIELILRRRGARMPKRIRLYVHSGLVNDKPIPLIQKLQDLSAITSRYRLLRRCKALGVKLDRLTGHYETIWKSEKRKVPCQGFELALFLFALERNKPFLEPEILSLVLSEVSTSQLLLEVLYEKGVISLEQFLQVKPRSEKLVKPIPVGVHALKRLQTLSEIQKGESNKKIYSVFDIFIV